MKISYKTTQNNKKKGMQRTPWTIYYRKIGNNY